MKGVPEAPQCGFSQRVCQVLQAHGTLSDCTVYLDATSLGYAVVCPPCGALSVYLKPSLTEFVLTVVDLECKNKVSGSGVGEAGGWELVDLKIKCRGGEGL